MVNAAGVPSRWILPLIILCLFFVPGAGRPLLAADFSPTGSLGAGREGHTATLLQNGKVLVAGGGGSAGVLASAELYDPITGTFSATPGSLNEARKFHTATLLPDGKVLIAGGQNGGAIGSAEIYDPATNAFTLTSSLNAARYRHTATLQANGRVLIVGGVDIVSMSLVSAELYDVSTGTFTAVTSTLNEPRSMPRSTLLPTNKVLVTNGGSQTIEIFDPVSDSFSYAGTFSFWRDQISSTLLVNGKVLVAGGIGEFAEEITEVELYDPAAGTATVINNSLYTFMYGHTATMLANGNVLFAGGYDRFGAATRKIAVFDAATNTFTSVAAGLIAARYGHTATLLPNGRVLVVGGFNGSYLNSAELYTPPSGSFTAANNLTAAREKHTATPLADGRVLLAGGYSGGALNSSEIFDPVTQSATPTGGLVSARYEHAATLLSNGKVLLTGGRSSAGSPQATVELFDPGTGSFMQLSGGLATARYAHTATLLADGTLLVVGGNGSSGALGSAELFDLASGTFTAVVGAMQSPRTMHTATLLANGKVLLAGGYNAGWPTSAELYDPATGTFAATAGSLITARSNHSATLLPGGKVLIAGGSNGGAGLTTAELFDLATGLFAAAGTHAARYSHTATLLGNGTVLLAGGDYGAGLANSELYDPASGSFSATVGSLNVPRSRHTATLLPSGKVLIAGGINVSALSSAELFDIGVFTGDARRPVLTTLTPTIGQPTRFTLAGSGFRGDSEGTGGGTNSSATNYPLFRLQRLDSGLTHFVTPSGWSATSFSTTSLYGLQSGYYQASLIANAIPSISRLIRIEPAVAWSPAALDFPAATLNVPSAPQAVAITNNGAADLYFGVKRFSPNDGKFTLAAGDTCVGALAPGADCSFSVVFQSGAPGSFAATLEVASNDPDAPLAPVTLTGMVLAPLITVTPAALDFPGVALDVSSAPQAVVIRNNGGSDLLLGTKAIVPSGGPFTISNDTCPATLAPAASCTLAITFLPTIPGSAAATLSIPSNDQLIPVQTVALTGSAVVPVASVTPATLDFPGATLAVTSAPQTVTITNTGSADLLLGSRTIAPNNGTFTITNDACPAALAPAASCTLGVVFLTSVPGNFAATLTIPSNDPASPVKTVALTGSAAAPLNVTFAGTGTGTVLVRPAPAGTSCTSDCSRSFAKDTLVTLVPGADVGATLAGWSGCDTVAGATCLVTMNAARGVTVTFAAVAPMANLAIAAGYNHTLALKGDGQVWAWGFDYTGQLGTGVAGTVSTVPVATSGVTGITAIAAGYFHSIALKDDGTVWTWGANGAGQLGTGFAGNSAVPQPVTGLAGVTAIAGGDSHTLALKNDGTVWSWGANGAGQLGNDSTVGSPVPVPVSGLVDVIAIAAGRYHSLALKNDGTVWAWGDNGSGQLGPGGTAFSPVPLPVSGVTAVLAIAAGSSHSVALQADTTVWSWGLNNHGQLGNSSKVSSSTPVPATDLSGVRDIAAGSFHTLALKDDATVWAWGDNYSGQLGWGMIIESVVPAQVPVLSGITAVATMGTHNVALKDDSTIWAWGYNYFGQLGNGTTTQQNTPMQLGPLYVRLKTAGQFDLYFPTIGAALVAVRAPSSLSTVQRDFSEAVDYSQCGQTVTIGAAYDQTFSTPLGFTVIQGSVSVSCGTLIVEALEIW